MTKWTTYAQNFEDVYLQRSYQILKGNIAEQNCNKILVDVGAWEPVADSVSKHFIDIGWRAILVEPQLEYFKKLSKFYSEFTDVQVLNCALSDESGTGNLFIPKKTTGWSSLNLDHAALMNESISKEQIKLSTLDEIHDLLNVDYFFLKIDAEGHESRILKGWNNTRVSPTIICLENSNFTIEHQLQVKSYLKYFDDGINSYFVKECFKEKISDFKPLNLTDDATFHIAESHWLFN